VNDETHKKLLLGLGLIVAKFGTLEAYMQMALSALLTRHQTIGMMVASTLSFDRSIQLFNAICRMKIKTPELLAEMDALCKKLSQAEQERNKLLHSNYLAGMEDEFVIRMKVAVKSSKQMHDLNPDELITLGISFEKLYVEFYTFFSKMHDAAMKKANVLIHEAFDI